MIMLVHNNWAGCSNMLFCWQYFIKLNVDDAVPYDFTFLIVVAKNANGEVLKVWTKIYDLCTPAQVEATPILWVLNFSRFENWFNNIGAADAKVCFDALAN